MRQSFTDNNSIRQMITLGRKVGILFLVMGGMLLLAPQDANAQRWLQTSQLVTNIDRDGPTRALLDTLVSVLERKDSIRVKRSPETKTKIEISDLKDKLINEQGIGLTSANKVFIDYRFEIKNRGFQETITAFNFVYRPRGGAQEDIKMLYIDATEKWVRDILVNKGTTLRTNQAALLTFKDQLAFARMVQNGKVVEIADRTVREGFERKKRELVQKIQRLTYEGL